MFGYSFHKEVHQFHYRPQRSCSQGNIFTGRNEVVAKVMFLHVSVILLTGGGSPGSPPGTRQTPPRPSRPPSLPPDQADPPGRRLQHTVNERLVCILLECILVAPVCHSVHRGGVCLSACWDTTPPGADTPLGADTPQADTPQEQTPPGADPPEADTPPEQKPPGSRHPPPWEQTPSPPADTLPPEQTPPWSRHHPPGKQTPAYGQ